jgi:uncharacterized protein YcfJ
MRTHSKIMMTTGCVAALVAASMGSAQAQEQGRVISSQAVIQQVAVPRQVCNNQQVAVQGQKSGAGGMMGAIAGGAIGNNVGAGSGRALATMIGVIGGAMTGDRIEGAPPVQMQTVQNCSTQTFYENRTSGYNVVYEYNGKQYNVQMPNDPGQFVQLQVTPVGGMSQPVQSASMGIPAPAIQPIVQQQVIQPQVMQPVVQQVVAAPQVIYAQPQVLYARPYYPVIYPSVSIGFGWRGGYGYGHRHWH